MRARGWGRGLVVGCCGEWLCRHIFHTVFEAFEDGAGIIGRLSQGIKYAVSHFYGCLKCCLFAAVLAVGKIFGKLVPFAADAQSPTLEGCGLVRVAGNVTLGHGCVCVLVLG